MTKYADQVVRPIVLLYDELSKRHRAYVDAFIQCGDKIEAYTLAGFTGQTSSARTNAVRLHRKLADVIEARVEDRIGTGAMMALNVIQTLMVSAESEAVKLAAAKDYLTRAGRDLPQVSKHLIDDTRDTTTQDIDQEILAILKQAEPNVATQH